MFFGRWFDYYWANRRCAFAFGSGAFDPNDSRAGTRAGSHAGNLKCGDTRGSAERIGGTAAVQYGAVNSICRTRTAACLRGRLRRGLVFGQSAIGGDWNSDGARGYPHVDIRSVSFACAVSSRDWISCRRSHSVFAYAAVAKRTLITSGPTTRWRFGISIPVLLIPVLVASLRPSLRAAAVNPWTLCEESSGCLGQGADKRKKRPRYLLVLANIRRKIQEPLPLGAAQKQRWNVYGKLPSRD